MSTASVGISVNEWEKLEKQAYEYGKRDGELGESLDRYSGEEYAPLRAQYERGMRDGAEVRQRLLMEKLLAETTRLADLFEQQGGTVGVAVTDRNKVVMEKTQLQGLLRLLVSHVRSALNARDDKALRLATLDRATRNLLIGVNLENERITRCTRSGALAEALPLEGAVWNAFREAVDQAQLGQYQDAVFERLREVAADVARVLP